MNSELKEGLVKLLSKLNEGLENGADFALEQAPLVVQEYVARERITTTTYVAVGVVLIVAAPILFRWLWRAAARWYPEVGGTGEAQENVRIAATIGSFVSLLLGLMIAVPWFDDCVTAWAAPRVLILEKLASLVNGR